MDLSPLRKFEILGPDAEALLQATMTRDIRRLADGQVVYTAMCNETGGMLDDGTVFRIAPDNFRFVGGAEYDGVWLREQAERLGLRVWVKESTDDLHNIGVQGPASREILSRDRLDAAGADAVRRAEVVPLLDRPARRAAGPAADRLAHRLLGRARLRALLPSEGRAGALRRGDGGGCPARDRAARPRGARHAADRGGADLRRLRVRRPGRPVRGRHRLHGHGRQGGRLRRPRRAARAARASAAGARRARARGQRDGRARRLRPRRPLPDRRDHERHALADPEEEHRPLPDRRAARRARHRGRGRQARRPPEADPGHRRADARSTTPRSCARARDRRASRRSRSRRSTATAS